MIEKLARVIEIIVEEKLLLNHLGEDAKDRIRAHSMTMMKELLESKSVRRIKMAASNVAKELRFSVYPDDRTRILDRVRAETGLTYFDLVGDVQKKIAAIIARGEVRSLPEFRALRDHLDDLEGGGDETAVRVVVGLLDAYEIHMANKKRQ